MAGADLDTIIRQLAKQQHKTLTATVKKQRDRYVVLAAKARDAESKQRYRQLAKETLEIGIATVKRLQTSADNAADSYARSIRQAVDALSRPKETPAPKKSSPPADKPARKQAKKTAKKNAKKSGKSAKA